MSAIRCRAERRVANTLYALYEDGQLPTDDPRVQELAAQHQEFKAHFFQSIFRFFVLGHGLVLYRYTKTHRSTKRMRWVERVGFFCTVGVMYYLLGERPPKEEMKLVMELGTEHFALMVQKRPTEESLFRSVLNIPLPEDLRRQRDADVWMQQPEQTTGSMFSREMIARYIFEASNMQAYPRPTPSSKAVGEESS